MAPLMAQTVTNNPPPFDPGTAPLPKSKAELWTWGISIITPMIVYLFGKIPQLPRPVLPILTPVIGIILGLTLDKLTSLNLTWWDAAQAGAVAVFIRESVNQLVTKQMFPREGSKTSTAPVDAAMAVKDPSEKSHTIKDKK